VGQLGRGIAPEIADAGGAGMGRLGQLRRRKPIPGKGPPFEGPVLAEETVEVAGVVKHGQIDVAPFRTGGIGVLGVAPAGAPGTEPVGHAVGGQGVVIKADPGPGGIAALQPPPGYPPGPAEAHPALRDAAGMEA